MKLLKTIKIKLQPIAVEMKQSYELDGGSYEILGISVLHIVSVGRS